MSLRSTRIKKGYKAEPATKDWSYNAARGRARAGLVESLIPGVEKERQDWQDKEMQLRTHNDMQSEQIQSLQEILTTTRTSVLAIVEKLHAEIEEKVDDANVRACLLKRLLDLHTELYKILDVMVAKHTEMTTK